MPTAPTARSAIAIGGKDPLADDCFPAPPLRANERNGDVSITANRVPTGYPGRLVRRQRENPLGLPEPGSGRRRRPLEAVEAATPARAAAAGASGDTTQGMSHENLDLALRLYELFNHRDLDGVLGLMHDEVEIEPRLGSLEGDYSGHEGVRRWWSDLLDALPDYHAEIEELDCLGDTTFGRIRGSAHGADSSAPLVESWWQLIRWSDGKCIWFRNFATEAEAIGAIRVQAR